MAKEDCKNGCKVDIWNSLWNDIYHELNPEVPKEQINPNSFTYASSRKRVDAIVELVKQFLKKHLTDESKYKRIAGE